MRLKTIDIDNVTDEMELLMSHGVADISKTAIQTIKSVLAAAPGVSPQGEAVAYGRVISGKCVTISLKKTVANDEPLYAAPVVKEVEPVSILWEHDGSLTGNKFLSSNQLYNGIRSEKSVKVYARPDPKVAELTKELAEARAEIERMRGC